MKRNTIITCSIITALVLIYVSQLITLDFSKTQEYFKNLWSDKIFSTHKNLNTAFKDVSKNKDINFVEPKMNLKEIYYYLDNAHQSKYSLDILAELYNRTTPTMFEEFIKSNEQDTEFAKGFAKESRGVGGFLASYKNGYQDFLEQKYNIENYFFVKKEKTEQQDLFTGYILDFIEATEITKSKGQKIDNKYILEISATSKFILTLDPNDSTKILSFQMDEPVPKKDNATPV